MSYDVTKLTRLKHLKELAERVSTECAKQTALESLSERVDQIISTGGEPNVITAIKVNGTAQTITNKTVDIPVPGYTVVKDESSSGYAAVYHFRKNGANEGVAINIPKDMVVQSGTVVTNPTGQTAGTYLKLVLANADNSELFIPVDSLIEYVTSGSAANDMVVISVDATTHKVSAAITDGSITKAKLTTDVRTAIDNVANKVDKVSGKGLSTEDFTTALKNKLDGMTAGATKVAASNTNGNIKINGVETTVYTEPSDVIHGAIATDAEITEMLNEVFTA